MLTFLAIGPWSPAQVVCRWAESTFNPPPELAAAIDRAWDEAGQIRHLDLFDGPMCRIESYNASCDRLELLLSRISYKPFYGTNLRRADNSITPNPAASLPRRDLANPVGVSCALISSDGSLLLGHRNDRVAYHPNRIHPFAGALEPSDNLDAFHTVHRELEEELSLTGTDIIATEQCLGLAEDSELCQPEVICFVRSTLPRQRISEKLRPEEHKDIYAIAPDAAAAAAAARNPVLTPIAAATVLLWGRTFLPAVWFDALTREFGR